MQNKENTTCLALLSRDGTGQDFLDATGKFQNLRRLTGFLQNVFVHCSIHVMKSFQKGGGMGEVVKSVTLDESRVLNGPTSWPEPENISPNLAQNRKLI